MDNWTHVGRYTQPSDRIPLFIIDLEMAASIGIQAQK
jgi:hypothetical protein